MKGQRSNCTGIEGLKGGEKSRAVENGFSNIKKPYILEIEKWGNIASMTQ